MNGVDGVSEDCILNDGSHHCHIEGQVPSFFESSSVTECNGWESVPPPYATEKEL